MKAQDGPANVDYDLLSATSSQQVQERAAAQDVVARLREVLEKEDEEIIGENEAVGNIFRALSSEQLHHILRDLEWALQRTNSLSYQDFKDREETLPELTESLVTAGLIRSTSNRSRGSEMSFRRAGSSCSRGGASVGSQDAQQQSRLGRSTSQHSQGVDPASQSTARKTTRSMSRVGNST